MSEVDWEDQYFRLLDAYQTVVRLNVDLNTQLEKNNNARLTDSRGLPGRPESLGSDTVPFAGIRFDSDGGVLVDDT
jgi:hypothetical protein